MNLETLTYEASGSVVTITMNRPDALNALSRQMTEDLNAAVQHARDDGARAVILAANGRAILV